MSEKEYKETLEDKILTIADKLKGHDYESILKKELKDIEKPEAIEIERAFKAVLKYFEDRRRKDVHQDKDPNTHSQSSGDSDEFLTREKAAKRIKVSLSTFKRIIKNHDIKEYSYNRIKRYKASDVDSLLKTVLGTSIPALCKERLMHFDGEEYNIMFFEKGELYDIILEDSDWIVIYNTEWMSSMRLSKNEFRKYFSIKGELEFDAKKYNI